MNLLIFNMLLLPMIFFHIWEKSLSYMKKSVRLMNMEVNDLCLWTSVEDELVQNLVKTCLFGSWLAVMSPTVPRGKSLICFSANQRSKHSVWCHCLSANQKWLNSDRGSWYEHHWVFMFPATPPSGWCWFCSDQSSEDEGQGRSQRQTQRQEERHDGAGCFCFVRKNVPVEADITLFYKNIFTMNEPISSFKHQNVQWLLSLIAGLNVDEETEWKVGNKLLNYILL